MLPARSMYMQRPAKTCKDMQRHACMCMHVHGPVWSTCVSAAARYLLFTGKYPVRILFVVSSPSGGLTCTDTYPSLPAQYRCPSGRK